MDADVPDSFMQEVFHEALALGCRDGYDFAVWGLTDAVSSEFIELGKMGGGYVVWYSDRGRRRELYRSSSADQVRIELRDAVTLLAADRGRGPRD